MKKFNWVKGVVLVVGGYGKASLVALRGQKLAEFKLKLNKSGTFEAPELGLIAQTHEELMELIYNKAINYEF